MVKRHLVLLKLSQEFLRQLDFFERMYDAIYDA